MGIDALWGHLARGDFTPQTTYILSLHFNCTLYTCTYTTVHCYIPVHTIVNLYIVIPYLRVRYNSTFYYLFFVLSLLHCGSFGHENKFLVCVKIPGNKDYSDSEGLVWVMVRCLFEVNEIC